MATGKTTVGRLLAGMIGFDFVDTDSEIEKRTGLSISDIFEKHGEMRFRELERKLCGDLGDRSRTVIATGGGTLIDEENQAHFTGAPVFRLDVPVDVLCQRADSGRPRPLLADDTGAAPTGAALQERLTTLLERRTPAYQKIGQPIDNSSRSPEETAARIASMLELPATTMTVNPLAALGVAEPTIRGRFGLSTIEIGHGSLSKLGRLIAESRLGSRAFVLMPSTVANHFRAQIETSLHAAAIPFAVLEIEDGDDHKNLEQIRHIIDQLIELGAQRDSVIVPVGGGVTGDTGGFVASAFMRGVPLVHVPTTLLAQVDSSIGGKVGVNHPRAKNLIGSFYQPHLVVMDPATLRTLPLDEIANGMAEVVKSAMIGSAEFFEYLEAQMSQPGPERIRDRDFLERCVIERNLGHTVGHALEAAAGYSVLKHGRAVSVGLVAAAAIAVNRGVAAREVLDRTRTLLSWCGLPTAMRDVVGGRHNVAVTDLIQHMRFDKKVRDGRLHFVLPASIGETSIVDDVSPSEIESVLGAMS
jgi:3-dehydroquinate synthetase